MKGKRRKKKYLIIVSTKLYMYFLDKCYRNTEEVQVAVCLTLELGIFFIFRVDMTNQ